MEKIYVYIGVVDPKYELEHSLSYILTEIFRFIVMPISLIIGLLVYYKKSKSSPKRKKVIIIVWICLAVIFSIILQIILNAGRRIALGI